MLKQYLRKVIFVLLMSYSLGVEEYWVGHKFQCTLASLFSREGYQITFLTVLINGSHSVECILGKMVSNYPAMNFRQCKTLLFS